MRGLGDAGSAADALQEAGRYSDSGHAGGDLALMRDLLRAVDARDASFLSSDLATSVESHLMAFACERSRLRGAVEPVA